MGSLLYSVTADAVTTRSKLLTGTSDADVAALAPRGTAYAAITTGALRTAKGSGTKWSTTKLHGLPKGWTPVELGFASSRKGLAVLSKGTGFRVYATSDGGSSWSLLAAAAQQPASYRARTVLPGATVNNLATAPATIFANTELPAGAKQLSSSPDPRLDSAPTSQGCAPFDDTAKWWSVPGMSAQDLFDRVQLKSQRFDSNWTVGSTQDSRFGSTRWESGRWTASTFTELLQPPTVLFTIIADGSGSDIRIDVQSVPKGASCNGTGVAHSVPTPTP
jgi:hypothetical protein